MNEPTQAQIDRAKDVAEQVREWRARQKDLIHGKCGIIRERACQQRQEKFLHESRIRLDGGSLVHIDARFIKCQGCPRFHRLANPESKITKNGSRISKIRYKVKNEDTGCDSE